MVNKKATGTAIESVINIRNHVKSLHLRILTSREYRTTWSSVVESSS